MSDIIATVMYMFRNAKTMMSISNITVTVMHMFRNATTVMSISDITVTVMPTYRIVKTALLNSDNTVMVLLIFCNANILMSIGSQHHVDDVGKSCITTTAMLCFLYHRNNTINIITRSKATAVYSTLDLLIVKIYHVMQ